MIYPFAIALALIAPITPASAVQTPTAPASSVRAQVPDYESWDTEKLYQQGSDLLRRGRSLNSAISALSIAARREPENLDIQLALGCAYASRFASVSQALSLSDGYDAEQKNYERRRAKWEEAQQDPARPEAGSLSPQPPLAPSTPDDARRFELPREEALRLLTKLGRQSVATFDAAHKLAASASTEQRCEAEYTRGWALFLLRYLGVAQGVVQDRPANTATSVGNTVAEAGGGEVGLSLGKEDVLSCFRDCAKVSPQNPVYWHSLGIALVPKYLDAAENGGYESYMKGQALHDKQDMDEATAAFEHALSLKPSDFDLLFQMATIISPVHPLEASTYLEKAAQRRATNAVLWYLLAEQRLREGEKQGASTKALQEKAVNAVQKGNIAPLYSTVPFVLPLPVQLKKAWGYREAHGLGDDSVLLLTLSERLFACLSKEIEQGDDDAVFQGVPAMMGMGVKAVGSVNRETIASDLDRQDSRTRITLIRRVQMGLFCCLRANDLVKKSQKLRPDERKARMLNEITDAMKYLDPIGKEVLR